MVDLLVRIGALELKNPIMVASGTFGYGTEYGDLIDPSRLGAVVTKAVTHRPREGNPPPRLWETPCGVLNSVGLENVGVEAFLKDKLPALLAMDTKVIVNVAGSDIDEYVEVVSKIEGQGVDGIEVNLSCPNVRMGGMAFGRDSHLTGEVVSAVRAVTSLPLLVKLTPNVTSLEEIAQSAASAGCDGLTLVNTFLGLAVDIDTMKPRLGAGAGGLSGPAIRPLALYNVWLVASNMDVPVIGVGGICSGQDAVEFLLCGATAVQIGTANFVDPSTAVRCLNFLRDYCEGSGIEHITDLIGKGDI